MTIRCITANLKFKRNVYHIYCETLFVSNSSVIAQPTHFKTYKPKSFIVCVNTVPYRIDFDYGIPYENELNPVPVCLTGERNNHVIGNANPLSIFVWLGKLYPNNELFHKPVEMSSNWIAIIDGSFCFIE